MDCDSSIGGHCPEPSLAPTIGFTFRNCAGDIADSGVCLQAISRQRAPWRIRRSGRYCYCFWRCSFFPGSAPFYCIVVCRPGDVRRTLAAKIAAACWKLTAAKRTAGTIPVAGVQSFRRNKMTDGVKPSCSYSFRASKLNSCTAIWWSSTPLDLAQSNAASISLRPTPRR